MAWYDDFIKGSQGVLVEQDKKKKKKPKYIAVRVN